MDEYISSDKFMILICVLVMLLAICVIVAIPNPEENVIVSTDSTKMVMPQETDVHKYYNMSVRKTKDGFQGVVRHCHNTPFVVIPIDSSIEYVNLDNDCNLISSYNIDTGIGPLCECRAMYKISYANGLEDPKIFMFNNEEWVTCNILGSKEQYHPCVNVVALFKVSDPKKTFRVLECPPNWNPMQRQKNWTFFQDGDRMLAEYSLSPHTILEVDPDSGKVTELVKHEKKIDWEYRCNSNPIPIVMDDKKYWLGMGHITELRNYKHFFYLFDSEYPYSITHTTKPFKLDKLERVQFAMGLSEYNDRFYISYGVEDDHNRICSFSTDEIFTMLKYHSYSYNKKRLILDD